MRTYESNMLAVNAETPAAAPPGLEQYHKALRKWLKESGGNTEYGATLYATIAALYETEGNINQAENHLIEAYKLCRNADLTSKAADIAERLYLLLWSQTKDCRENEHKAVAWRKLCDQLRRESYRRF